jgi:hypothetical protein
MENLTLRDRINAAVVGFALGMVHGCDAQQPRQRATGLDTAELLAAADRLTDAILCALAPPATEYPAHTGRWQGDGESLVNLPKTAVVPVRAIRRQHCTVLNEIGEAGA